MGGAILYGALESGVLPKESVYVYDINPAMMEKAKGWGVNLARMMRKYAAALTLCFWQ